MSTTVETATGIRPVHVEIPEEQIGAVADVIMTAAARSTGRLPR